MTHDGFQRARKKVQEMRVQAPKVDPESLVGGSGTDNEPIDPVVVEDVQRHATKKKPVANPDGPMMMSDTKNPALTRADRTKAALDARANHHAESAVEAFEFEDWQDAVEAALTVLEDPESVPDMFRVRAASRILHMALAMDNAKGER